MRLALLFSLSFAFLALFPPALSQCLSGYRLVGSECIPSNTISTFLSSRTTLYRFPFDNLLDSSGKGNVLVSSGPLNISPVPGTSGSSLGLRAAQRATLSNIPITSNTCFYIKFFYPGLSFDFFLLTLTNAPFPQSQFSIIISKAGKLQIRTPAGRQGTSNLIKKNSLNSVGVCLRSNGNVITAVNGVRRGTFTFAPLVSKNYNVNIGGSNTVVYDEILAYDELDPITYDHSLVFNQVPNYSYRPLGVLDLAPKTAAFTHVGKVSGKTSLFVTHFGAFTGPFTGSVEVVEDIGSKLNQISTTTFQTVGTGLTWPNTVLNAPFSALNKDNLITVASGFLVPFSRTGSVVLIDLNTNAKYTISTPETNFFYHMTEWFDVDGDGLLDLLAAKTQFPVFPFARKLVWFKNPGTISGGWTENLLINNGPDLFFRLHDFDNDGVMEIVASISFGNKLSVFKNNGVFSNPSDWTEIVIDNTIGLLFDVTLADMNKDGKLDLLVTNHVSATNASAVFVYEVPNDIVTGKFVRHTIAVGSFVTTQPGSGQASPGGAVHFHPKVANVNEKPYVFVSGDGTQRAYILRPLSSNPLNWDYDLKEILYGGNTLGAVSVDDVDGDGYSELFAPVFEDGKIHVYTFSP